MSWPNLFIQWGFLLVQLITAILALRSWRKKKSMAWKFFILLWPITFITEATGKILAGFGLHNVWLYNLYDVIFYPVIIFIYSHVFSTAFIKMAIKAITFVFVPWAIWNFILQSNNGINTYYSLAGSSIIILLAIFYLIKLFLDTAATFPLRYDYYYWFSTGFLLYFGFNVIMMGMYTKIITSKVVWLPHFLFYANHLITFVLHSCLWAGFYAARKWMK